MKEREVLLLLSVAVIKNTLTKNQLRERIGFVSIYNTRLQSITTEKSKK
jgi:recombination DNA repair RAD52 pathway protein